MMYAQWRGTFYVQLEDDILTKPYFVATMRDFALEKNAAHEPWFVIDFCQLGTSSSHVFTNFVITNLRKYFHEILFVYFSTMHNFLIEIKLWKKGNWLC